MSDLNPSKPSSIASTGFDIPEDQLTEAERLALELERRASALENENFQEPFVSLLTFYLGDEWFAIPLERVKVVSRLLEVTPVPGASNYVLGVVNYKSALFPVIDLHQMLGLEPGMPTRSTRLVIINNERDSFALIVDSMTEVKEVREAELNNQLSSSQDVTQYVSSEINLEGKLLGNINIDAILKTVMGEDQTDTSAARMAGL